MFQKPLSSENGRFQVWTLSWLKSDKRKRTWGVSQCNKCDLSWAWLVANHISPGEGILEYCETLVVPSTSSVCELAMHASSWLTLQVQCQEVPSVTGTGSATPPVALIIQKFRICHQNSRWRHFWCQFNNWDEFLTCRDKWLIRLLLRQQHLGNDRSELWNWMKLKSHEWFLN